MSAAARARVVAGAARARVVAGASLDRFAYDRPMPEEPRLPVAALFDWDGTLADTMSLIFRANVVVLGEFGIRLDRTWFRERYTPDWRRSYREIGLPEHLWDAAAARWSEEMQAGRPRALPWARGALRRLKAHGVGLGLVTASTRAVVEPSLSRLGLDGLFETAFYSDDVEHGKPHPEALVRALAQLGVAAADTVYVGDTTVDLEMATAAGAPFVAVGTTTSEATFLAAGVERVWPGVGAWAADLLGRAAPVRPPARLRRRESTSSDGGSEGRRRTG